MIGDENKEIDEVLINIVLIWCKIFGIFMNISFGNLYFKFESWKEICCLSNFLRLKIFCSNYNINWVNFL